LKRRFKIVLVVLLLLITVVVTVKYQAKRIVIGLMESNSNNSIEVNIDRINIHPVTSSISLKNVLVTVKDKGSKNFKKGKIDKVFIDVVSLWDFFSGGTLIIEKFECEGGDITLFNRSEFGTAKHSFDLHSIIQRIKTDAVRFRIQDIVFRDLNLTLDRDSARAPTTIRHLHARAQDLYLSADSLLRKKPLVEFYLTQQIITLPNQISVGFDSLYFSTSDNSIQVNNLELSSPKDAGNTYQLHSDKVRLAHFSFESFYNKGTLVLDSIFLGKSNIMVDWTVDQSKKGLSNQQSLSALPRIDIGSISFEEISSDIIIRSDSIKNTFKVEHASLTIDRLKYRPDSSRIIYSPRYNLLISQYSTFLGKDQSSVSFDTIQIQKNSLSLLNFVFKKAEQRRPLIQAPRFELSDVDWYDLLVNRQLVANEASVFNPIIVTTIQPKATRVERFDYFGLIASLQKFLRVNIFTLKNASVFVTFPDKSMDLRLRGFNTTLKSKDLIRSENINEGFDAVKDLSFGKLHLSNPDFNAQVDNLRFANRASVIGNFSYKASSNVILNLAGLKLANISWSELNNSLALEGLDWQSLEVELTNTQENQAQKGGNAKLPTIQINNIHGGNTSLLYKRDSLNLRALLSTVNLNMLGFGDSVYLNGIDLKGKSLALDLKGNEVRVGEFSFTDQGGAVNNIQFDRTEKDSIHVLVEKLSFEAKLPDFVRKKYVLSKLAVDGMKIRLSKRDSARYLRLKAESRLRATDIAYGEKNFSIGTVTVQVGSIDLLNEKWVKNEVPADSAVQSSVRNFKQDFDTLIQTKYAVKKVNPSEKIRKTDSSDLDTGSLYKQILKVKSGREGIKVDVSHIESLTRDSDSQIHAKVNSIQFNAVEVETNKLAAQIKNGSLKDLVFTSDHLKNPWELVKDNQFTAAINNMKAEIETNGNLIRFDQLDYDPRLASGRISQFEFRPIKDKQQFLNDSYYQTNYMHARIKSIAFNNLNIQRFLSDTAFHLTSIHVESPGLEIGRDKTHPFFEAAIKPLPTNAFQKVKVKFKIDTLKVSDGSIAYTEKSRVTSQEGTINFSRMEALVRNVKNIDLHVDDSLRIRATTLFMDSAHVNLRVRESYHDSLGGFVLATQVSPFNTSILNKALIPMASVDFQSGYVDTLYMRAVGREYLSLGSMKFLYHDLKVEFLDKNDTSRHSIKNQLLKFAANTFVIRTNNTDRPGTVFYERDRNRAVFQYWVKMILSGVTTSVGVKSNKKQIKKYMKELNQKNLPPIEDKFDLD